MMFKNVLVIYSNKKIKPIKVLREKRNLNYLTKCNCVHTSIYEQQYFEFKIHPTFKRDLQEKICKPIHFTDHIVYRYVSAVTCS
jgi:hypothetical protein